MAEKEYTDEEINALDGFLQYENNYKTYQELLGESLEGYKDLFEPLKFFRLLRDQQRFIHNNLNKPLTVIRNLQKLNLKDEQLCFLCNKLEEYIEDIWAAQYSGTILINELSRLRDKLNVSQNQNERKKEKEQKFDFEKVNKAIRRMSEKDTIEYLIRKKTEYLQEVDPNSESGISFDKKCDLEIEKIEKIRKVFAFYDEDYNDDYETNADNETVEDNNQIRNRDLTLDQTVLFFTYLFNYSKVNCHNNQKAKVIAALTGFSENTIQQQLSTIHKKASDSPKAYSKDIKRVRNNFERLDFIDITKIIDEDLKFN